MKRKALITANAGGPAGDVNAVLARFGFQTAVQVADRAQAIKRLGEDQYDLAMVPFHDIDPMELLALEGIIRKNPGLSVIATGPAADANLLMRAMRAGVTEFLVAPMQPEELASAVERLTRRMVTDTARGDLLAVYSGKGGLGTTSIAVNVAQAFATLRQQARVALADLVVQGGDVRVFLDLKPAYDLSHLVAKGKEVDGELLNSILSPVPGEVPRKILRALDIQSGKVIWELPQIGGGDTWGGTLATVTGLLFFGEDSGMFMAVDAASGKPLWRFQANQMWKASPMAYQFDGKQYLAVASGHTVTAFALLD